jgi:rubrerythrin
MTTKEKLDYAKRRLEGAKILRHQEDIETYTRHVKELQKQWKREEIAAIWQVNKGDNMIFEDDNTNPINKFNGTQEEWDELATQLRLQNAPSVYACKKCGYPVVKGNVCTYCWDTNPSQPSILS